MTKLESALCVAAMQILADSKGKVALDDITRFHVTAHYISGDEFFTGILYSVTPAAFRHILHLQATTLTLTRTLDLLNPKSIGLAGHCVEDYYCVKFQIIPLRDFRFIMLNIHTTGHTS